MAKKTYKNIQEFLALEAMEVSDDNGLYLVESLNDTLEERIGKAIAKEKMLDAKMTEIVQLNDSIHQLNDSIKEKDDALAEKDKTISTLNDKVTELEAQIAELNTNADGQSNTLTEKENTISELNKQIETLNQTIADKDAEIAALGKKAPEVPASQNTPAQEGEKKEDELKAHNVTHQGMTLKEETEAIKARVAFLNGQA